MIGSRTINESIKNNQNGHAENTTNLRMNLLRKCTELNSFDKIYVSLCKVMFPNFPLQVKSWDKKIGLHYHLSDRFDAGTQ